MTDAKYWANEGKFQEDYDRLFKRLVPSSGCSRFTHGEVLRAATRIYYDHYNNGRCNMYEGSYVDNLKPALNIVLPDLWIVAQGVGVDQFEMKLGQFMLNNPESEQHSGDYDDYEPDHWDAFEEIPDEIMDEVMDVVVAYVKAEDEKPYSVDGLNEYVVYWTFAANSADSCRRSRAGNVAKAIELAFPTYHQVKDKDSGPVEFIVFEVGADLVWHGPHPDWGVPSKHEEVVVALEASEVE
jgi:hypothetical protein